MKKRKIIVMLLCMVTLFVVSVNTVEASASKKGMKFLKGAWLTAGNSQAEKAIFTKKYMKIYSLWNENHTRIKSPKAKMLR